MIITLAYPLVPTDPNERDIKKIMETCGTTGDPDLR